MRENCTRARVAPTLPNLANLVWIFFLSFLFLDFVCAQVILCANSKPALNDVTYSELLLLVEQAALLNPELARAVEEGRLWVMDSGQASPCLDLG